MSDLKDFFDVIHSLSVHDLEVLIAIFDKEGHDFVLRSMKTFKDSKKEFVRG